MQQEKYTVRESVSGLQFKMWSISSFIRVVLIVEIWQSFNCETAFGVTTRCPPLLMSLNWFHISGGIKVNDLRQSRHSGESSRNPNISVTLLPLVFVTGCSVVGHGLLLHSQREYLGFLGLRHSMYVWEAAEIMPVTAPHILGHMVTYCEGLWKNISTNHLPIHTYLQP